MTINDYEKRYDQAEAKKKAARSSVAQQPPPALKYTPVLTRIPTEFGPAGYRCKFMNNDVSIFIVITIYNEGKDDLERTLRGVCKNLRSFIGREDKRDIWKSIVVCIVSDGRTKANQETLEYATELGIFSQDQVAAEIDLDRNVGMHLFETTVQLADQKSQGSKFPPLQIMFALKEYNGGKIDSHWWFFKAFAQQIVPEFTFLLDVGTRPRKKALYFLWQSMKRNEQIAGCCGEITTMKQFNVNPIVQSQLFEYKVANFFDKTTESVLGYISVLPGAFSAYRWRALQGAPLQKYFHHISTPMGKLTPFEANQYLAEDRILCFELVAKRNEAFTLHYDRRAVAETDSPTRLIDLIKQRRRWLNGSLFATLYAVINLPRLLFYSNHSLARKLVFIMQFTQQAFVLVLAWFLVANFYLTFNFSTLITFGNTDIVFLSLRYVFAALLITQFVIGLGNRAESVSGVYFACSLIWGMFLLFTAGLSFSVLFTDNISTPFAIGIILSIGLVMLAALLHGEILPVVGATLQYMLFAPSFLLIFPVYSMCNLHDISWGTKGVDAAVVARETAETDSKTTDVNERVRAKLRRISRIKKTEKEETHLLQMRFQKFRSVVLLMWMLSQGLYASLITLLNSETGNDNEVALLFLRIMFLTVSAFNVFRFVLSIVYLIFHAMTKSTQVPSYPVIRERSEDVSNV